MIQSLDSAAIAGAVLRNRSTGFEDSLRKLQGVILFFPLIFFLIVILILKSNRYETGLETSSGRQDDHLPAATFGPDMGPIFDTPFLKWDY